MDLVSTTLDKYLKHRFNGTNETSTTSSSASTAMTSSSHQNQQSSPPHEITNGQQEQFQTSQTTRSSPITDRINDNHEHNHLSFSNGVDELASDYDEIVLPSVHQISFRNTRPCCVGFRNDLRFIAAGFEDSHIYLWDLEQNQSSQLFDPASDESKKELELGTNSYKILGHSGAIYSIKFVNEDDLMLSCSEDTTIRLWCVKTKCNLKIFRGHTYPIWTLDVAPQGLYFASGSMDTTARLWRLDKPHPLRILCGHDDDVECITFHPNEKYLATGSTDTTIRLWSISDGKMVRLMVGHEDSITSLSFLPDGKFLTSASSDGVIKIWNLATNSVISDSSVPASLTISFSPEQKFISSCGIDNILSLWQVKKTNLEERLKLKFPSKSLNLLRSHFHMDNKLFVITFKNDADSDHSSNNHQTSTQTSNNSTNNPSNINRK